MKPFILGMLVALFTLSAPFAVFAIDETPPPSTSTSGNGGGNIYCSGPLAPGWNVSLPGGGCGGTTGTVLGASTGPATSCTTYITSYMHVGWNNDAEEVRKLQTFLGKNLGIELTVTGVFDEATLSAVNKFQEKYTDEILTPWGITKGTGYVYKTTVAKINALQCQGSH